MQADRDKLCQRFGKEYREQWGWAAEALKPRAANFAEIEAAVSFDHYRPYFKLACHSNHAGSKGIQFDLGNALNPPDSDIMLAGPSDAGFAIRAPAPRFPSSRSRRILSCTATKS